MRGILMVEPLYHQTIRGAKTQTRRASGLEQVNGAPATKKKPALIANPDDWFIVSKTSDFSGDPGTRIGDYFITFENKQTGKREVCHARYLLEETLFIKEPWRKPAGHHPYHYKYALPDFQRDMYDWKNKMFMPAEAARAFIRITGIRCERLLDISDEDCIAEGVNMPIPGGNILFTSPKDNKPAYIPKDSFLSLYKFANKVKEVPNIWVWVYDFEYLKDYKYADHHSK